MRFLSVFILTAALGLSACGPKGQHRKNTSFSGTTGFTKDGSDFVSNGDLRVEQALRLKETAPSPNSTQSLKVRQKTPLSEKLKEFEISRFHDNSNQPTRFGDTRMELKVIFTNNVSVAFRDVKLEGAKPNFTVNAVSGRFSLTGSINDLADSSHGKFIFTDLRTKDSAEILLWAYRAKLKIRTDRTKKVAAGSKLEKQIKDWSENTFGWVNNWNVPAGPSFYLIDIVRVIRGNTLPDERGQMISIKGESRRTGEKTYKAETDAKDTNMQLIGNGEDTAGRMFQVKIKDQDSNQENEFMLDVQPDEKVVAPGEPPQETTAPEEPEEFSPQVEPAVPASPAPTTPPAQPSMPEQKPEQPAPPPQQPAQPPAAPVKPSPPAIEEPVTNGKSFLRVDMSRPRTAKMTRDFNQNRNLKSVTDWIKTYQGSYRSGLQSFYQNAAPFRRILESVGAKFDVSPVFAYVTVIESYYFTRGKYEIEGADGSSALGPFQLLYDTAAEVGLYVTKSKSAADERRFFVPSSCGAAKYFRKLVDKFGEGDSTLGILGYNQGDAGAAAAIYCSFDDSVSNRKACADRIRPGDNRFSRGEFGRFLKLYKKYDYTYAEMDRMAAISKGMRNYVSQKLAIYFISNDMSKYNFSTPTNRALPSNGTVMPRRALNDSACTNAVSGLVSDI